MNESNTIRRSPRRTRRPAPAFTRQSRRQNRRTKALQRFIGTCLALVGLLLALSHWPTRSPLPEQSQITSELPPLVMPGGDPYVRALMRTISASESNDASPYTVLYGGQHISDFTEHPDLCIKIVNGPNKGNCTTAAGRYQFLTTTWAEKARLYHPNSTRFLFWETYSFEPQYQDEVVYAWLRDPQAWGVDIPTLLRAGEINPVLELLSGTWTSLGYGIEDNQMTGALPEIYQKVLQEELEAERASRHTEARPIMHWSDWNLLSQQLGQESIQGSF
ncbi:glycoside hydrolase family protein [Trichocoleus sp. FACHB-591]|uniref:glycoside hydrolase family 24 protein n=1 Tax=Trichocoleus sp. FACHB-591 TaxID=2692872 RepID=UPI00351C2BC0